MGLSPRVRGNPGRRHVPAPPCIRGLSPRVRGNPMEYPPAAIASGSIPARAGEPIQGHRAILETEVYPRACGGTANDNCILIQDGGLSPRVRGNPGRDGAAVYQMGSIPARAGEPI